MSEVKRFKASDLHVACCGDTIVVNAEDFDARDHAAEVYFGSWKRTEQELDAQRLRADTAEAELEEVVDELRVTVEDRDNAKRNSSAFEDRMGSLQCENGRLERRIEELVEQGKIAEQEVIIAAGLLNRAASEIDSLASSLENACEDFEGEDDEDQRAVGEVEDARKLAEKIRAALNPNPECCKVSAEDQALLDAGEYTPEELFGIGGKPSCPKCFNPNPEAESHE